MGWSRYLKFLWIRLNRLRATPHAIALGFAFGAFSSFTPFMGLHITLGGFLAYVFRGNLIAAAVGTVVGNPFTFPIIWYAVYWIGASMMGEAVSAQVTMDSSEGFFSILFGPFDQAWPIILRMAIGSLPLGVPIAILCYVVVKTAVVGFQHNRRQRLIHASKRRVRIARIMAPTTH